MERAEKVIYIFYATAVFGFVALVIRKKFPKVFTPLTVVTLIMGVASLGAGGWISKAGGQIRHPEFRAESDTSTNGATHEHGASEQSHKMQLTDGHQPEMSMSDQTPSTNATPHQHDMSGQPHEKMQSADMSGHQHEMTNSEQTLSTNIAAHQHGASEPSHEKMQPAGASGHKHEMTMPDQAAEKTPMPDTIEGVWKAIPEHHGELESSVKARQFKEVQFHEGMIGDLVKRLGELTPESGVSKIIHALDELKSSAETGSDTVMKIRFKEFEAALAELEQQMKNQQSK